MIDAILNYPQVLRNAGWKKVINGNEEQGYATYYSDTQDYLIRPHIDETYHQFAILYIYNRDDVGPINNWEEIDVEQTEVTLSNMRVDTYYGEAFSDVENTESYTIVMKNQTGGNTYTVSLASFPNSLTAPVAGTYTVVSEITAVEQATIEKQMGEGESAVTIKAESGTVVISGNVSNMEITVNITLPDGSAERLHYSGPVQIEEVKVEMYSEFEVLNITSMTLEAL